MSRKNAVCQAGPLPAHPWHLLPPSLSLSLHLSLPLSVGNYRGKRKRITGRDVPNPYRTVLYHVLCMLPAIKRNQEKESERERNENEEEQTKANSVARSGRRYRVEDIAREHIEG